MNLLFSINQKCVSLLQTCLQSIALQGGDTVYHVYVFHSVEAGSTSTFVIETFDTTRAPGPPMLSDVKASEIWSAEL